MKYYFPTSTLNFDAIASSMCIMPPSYFRDGAIGFSRYTRTLVDREDAHYYLYSRPVTWEPSVGDVVDYPMLVEIEDDGLAALGERMDAPEDVKALRMSRPYYFSSRDIVSKRIRFLFRNQEELKLIVGRTRANVAECKCFGVTEAWRIDNFALIGSLDDVVDFGTLKINFSTVSEDAHSEGLEAWLAYVRRDRLDGAKAGFRAGQWIRALFTGRFVDTMREPMSFETWRESLTPEANALIDMICGDAELKWDVNRGAVIDFCARCWNECLAQSKDEIRHEMLRNIARSVADTTYLYPIHSISDPEMQALACLIVAGKREAMLVNLLKTEKVQCPELALALHGALVGYSILSRALFEKRSYVDDPAQYGVESHPVVKQVARHPAEGGARVALTNVTRGDVPQKLNGGLSGWTMQIWLKVQSFIKLKGKKRVLVESSLRQALLDCRDERELLQALPKKYEGWGYRTTIYKDLKKAMSGTSTENSQEDDLFSRSAQEGTQGDYTLIDDVKLSEDVATHFSDLGCDRVRMLQIAVSKFIKKYMADGYYGQHPEKYKRTNSDVIDHMVKCFASLSTPDLNFGFEGEEEARFVAFLEGRYHCHRSTH